MSIHQEIEINASPATIYNTLMTSDQFEKMTGGRAATISQDAGGSVSLFGGGIQARNVELVRDKRIVQAWRATDWPEGVYSLVRFELNENGSTTKISFDQVGHPDAAQEHLDAGWHQMYWNPMKEMVGKS